MNKNTNFIIIIISSILGAGIFQIFSINFTSLAQSKDNAPKPEQIKRTCYEAVAPNVVKKPSKIELESRLNILDKQYKDKLIDEKTYKTSRQNIENELKNFK